MFSEYQKTQARIIARLVKDAFLDEVDKMKTEEFVPGLSKEDYGRGYPYDVEDWELMKLEAGKKVCKFLYGETWHEGLNQKEIEALAFYALDLIGFIE